MRWSEPPRLTVIFLSAVAIGAPAMRWFTSPQERQAPRTMVPQDQVRLVREGSRWAGRADAKVTIVEFADFRCPACALFEPIARTLRATYGQRIQYVFRHGPMASRHPTLEKAAEAAECAGEQGKFFEAVELLYQHRRDLSISALKRHARTLGLDEQRFAQCLDTGAMADKVARDRADARALGFNTSPTLVISEKVMEGVYPAAQVTQWVEEALRVHGEPPRGNQPRSSSLERPGDSPGAGQPRVVIVPLQPLSGEPLRIQTEDAYALYARRAEAVFVDVRDGEEYMRGHIQGALSLPLAEMEYRWTQLPRDRVIVLYCSGGSCSASLSAGRILLVNGFSPDHVKIYEAGFAAWAQAGYPVVRGERP